MIPPNQTMSLSKKIIRKIILPFVINIKADKIILKKAKKSCCIINFHGVRKHNESIFNNRHIPITEFEKIIAYLKENFEIVSLSEIFKIHREKRTLSKKTIAITFDDGYFNNFEHALPILKKYNSPATFYIISKGLTQKDFIVWPDAIDLIKKYNKTALTVNGHTFSPPTYININVKSELINYLKTTGNQAESLAQSIFNGEAKKQVENLKELMSLIDSESIKRYISEPLLEFGSHTHSHFCLEYLDKTVLIEELKRSKELIETITNRRVISLAFPDGSYNSDTLAEAERLGYTNLVAVDYHFNENNKIPNLLSRFTISNSTTFESNVLRLAKQFDKYGFN